MNMRKFCTFLCSVSIVLVMLCTSAFAVGAKEEIIDLGDGFYAVEVINQSTFGRTKDTASGGKTGKVYNGSTLIGSATLWASFDTSGSRAEATDAFISGSGENGGTYVQGTSSYSGNTASGTAYFEYNGQGKSLRITLTCSPDGVLS